MAHRTITAEVSKIDVAIDRWLEELQATAEERLRVETGGAKGAEFKLASATLLHFEQADDGWSEDTVKVLCIASVRIVDLRASVHPEPERCHFHMFDRFQCEKQRGHEGTHYAQLFAK